MVTIDPNNGHVISIVAGKDFKAGGFNRATMAKRQLGSSLNLSYILRLYKMDMN